MFSTSGQLTGAGQIQEAGMFSISGQLTGAGEIQQAIQVAAGEQELFGSGQTSGQRRLRSTRQGDQHRQQGPDTPAETGTRG